MFLAPRGTGGPEREAAAGWDGALWARANPVHMRGALGSASGPLKGTTKVTGPQQGVRRVTGSRPRMPALGHTASTLDCT